jgi:homoserine kinase type II
MDLLELLATTYPLTPPLTTFALAAAGTNNPTLGIRTGVGNFVWKAYTKFHDQASLAYEHMLLHWLATQALSFRVPAPLPARTGTTLTPTAAGWGALFPLAPGQRPLYSDPAQIRLVGAGLGELHRALARYPLTPRAGLWGYAELHRVHPRLPDPYALTAAQLGVADAEPQRSLLIW